MSKSIPRHAASSASPRRSGTVLVNTLAVVLLAAVAVTGWVVSTSTAEPASHPAAGRTIRATSATSTSTTTTVPPTTTTTDPRLAPATPGFVAGRITAVGDSVMIDATGPIQAAIPGAVVNATVSRQWSTGVAVVAGLKAAGQLGTVVVVDLGTNGPIGPADFDAMMQAARGAARVIFVTVHVPTRGWQDPNNAVLRAGVLRYPNAVLVDFQALALAHPEWFAGDGVHMAIGGPGAQAMAALIAGAA